MFSIADKSRNVSFSLVIKTDTHNYTGGQNEETHKFLETTNVMLLCKNKWVGFLNCMLKCPTYFFAPSRSLSLGPSPSLLSEETVASESATKQQKKPEPTV